MNNMTTHNNRYGHTASFQNDAEGTSAILRCAACIGTSRAQT